MFNQSIVAKPSLVGRKRLARLTGERDSTIKHYTEVGLLPFQQAERGLARRYDAGEATERLREIRGLQAVGLSIEEIKQRLRRGV
jgi:DNA-binding transcriptional MerR regulator